MKQPKKMNFTPFEKLIKCKKCRRPQLKSDINKYGICRRCANNFVVTNEVFLKDV